MHPTGVLALQTVPVWREQSAMEYQTSQAHSTGGGGEGNEARQQRSRSEEEEAVWTHASGPVQHTSTLQSRT